MGMKVNGSTGLTFPDSTTMATGSQAVRAWVNFNGTGTVAIRASYNVSSITDNGTGNYTVNFTTAMPDTNYAVNITADMQVGVTNLPFPATNSSGGTSGSKTVSAFGIAVFQPAYSLLDTDAVCVSVFR